MDHYIYLLKQSFIFQRNNFIVVKAMNNNPALFAWHTTNKQPEDNEKARQLAERISTRGIGPPGTAVKQ